MAKKKIKNREDMTENEIIIDILNAHIEYAEATKKFSDLGNFEDIKESYLKLCEKLDINIQLYK